MYSAKSVLLVFFAIIFSILQQQTIVGTWQGTNENTNVTIEFTKDGIYNLMLDDEVIASSDDFGAIYYKATYQANQVKIDVFLNEKGQKQYCAYLKAQFLKDNRLALQLIDLEGNVQENIELERV